MVVSRKTNILVNRLIIILLLVVSTLQYFWSPQGAWWIIDILFRTHILFLCGVMGHEASHGVCGNTKASNIWWGRISFFPIFVPNVQFRITHRFHHSFTNEEFKDPDLILKIQHWWQFPGRALAMPHSWLVWLRSNGLLTKKIWIEWGFTYLFFTLYFGSIAYFVGVERILLGLIPAQILNSFLLWYPFAVKTHEGHLTGKQEYRSHDYYGPLFYWLTLGLSLHRAHHMFPSKGWLQLMPYIQKGPLFKRSIYRPS
jgi:fatty acid desaturase